MRKDSSKGFWGKKWVFFTWKFCPGVRRSLSFTPSPLLAFEKTRVRPRRHNPCPVFIFTFACGEEREGEKVYRETRNFFLKKKKWILKLKKIKGKNSYPFFCGEIKVPSWIDEYMLGLIFRKCKICPNYIPLRSFFKMPSSHPFFHSYPLPLQLFKTPKIL